MYVLGGIVAVLTKDDIETAHKYGFIFHDFGCLVPANMDYFKAYNNLALTYIPKEFGGPWQKDLRENLNIIGRKTK